MLIHYHVAVVVVDDIVVVAVVVIDVVVVVVAYDQNIYYFQYSYSWPKKDAVVVVADNPQLVYVVVVVGYAEVVEMVPELLGGSPC